MLELLRHLTPDEQRELIALLAPSRRLDQVDDDDLFPTLRATLRTALQVPAEADLPMHMRRRLVDVAGWFRVVDDTSTCTDLELARAISEFALQGADEMQSSTELRDQFDTFFRTKSKDERDAFLASVARLHAVRDAGDAEPADSPKGGAAVADALLSGLSSASARPPRRARTSTQLTEQAPKVAAALSGASVAGLTAAATGATLAAPLSAVAGGLFMAGLGLKHRKLQRVSSAPDEKATRARRARNSKLVQHVVALSAFLVASTDIRHR